MLDYILHISFFNIVNIVLVCLLLFIGYQYLETFWSYKISKPFSWEQAVKNKNISKDLLKIERQFRDKVRFYNLWFQVEQLKKNSIKGAFAELGVHQGKTAKAIHLMDSERDFHLFDTFNGFDQSDLDQEKQEDKRFSTKNFSDTDLISVKEYLGDKKTLKYYPGFFPDTAKDLKESNFALVHIDADLYAPTKDALEFFYPRLNPGGVMIIHDYNHNWDGIPKAIDAFLKTIPESLIETPDWQGSAMIIKNK